MLHPEQEHLKLTFSSACIGTHPIHALVSSCHSHSNALLWWGHTSFAAPHYLTLCIDRIILCVRLRQFPLPLLILIFKGIPSSSPDLLLWLYHLKHELAHHTANLCYSENKFRTLVLEGGSLLMMATRHVLTWCQPRLKRFQDKTVLTKKTTKWKK